MKDWRATWRAANALHRAACESCTGDSSCADGLSCSTLENGNFCLPSCAGGAQCPADYSCNGETREPDAGRCDACGGQCDGATPACIAETGMCGECSNDTPCPIGEFCDPMTNTCSVINHASVVMMHNVRTVAVDQFACKVTALNVSTIPIVPRAVPVTSTPSPVKHHRALV